MSANFWKGSQCSSWMYETAKAVKLERQKGNEYLSEDQRACLEIFFCDVILAIGKNLKLRQQVVGTAMMYFKRFYLKNPWTAIKPYLMSLTCVYLAAKVEESGPIQAGHVSQSGKIVMNQPMFKDYLNYKIETNDIIECEFFLVQAMGCCLIVFHPYRSLVEYANDAKISDTVLPLAWKIVNDSHKCDICFYQPPYLIALAALQIGSSVLNGSNGSVLKEDKFSPWLASLSVSPTEVMEVVQALMALYSTLSEYNVGDLLQSAIVAVGQKSIELDASLPPTTAITTSTPPAIPMSPQSQ